jgi:hypothetical protein
MSLVSHRRRSSITLPAKLKVDYEDMVDASTIITSLVRIDKHGKLAYGLTTRREC